MVSSICIYYRKIVNYICTISQYCFLVTWCSMRYLSQPVHTKCGNSPTSKVKKKSINREFKHIVMLLSEKKWSHFRSDSDCTSAQKKKNLLPQKSPARRTFLCFFGSFGSCRFLRLLGGGSWILDLAAVGCWSKGTKWGKTWWNQTSSNDLFSKFRAQCPSAKSPKKSGNENINHGDFTSLTLKNVPKKSDACWLPVTSTKAPFLAPRPLD